MRYEAEISLRLIGDKQECQKYVTRARTVLGEVWNRDIETGDSISHGGGLSSMTAPSLPSTPQNS